MVELRQQSLHPLEAYLEPDEKILFHKETSKFLWRSDLWLLTNQRFLIVSKRGLVEISLFAPGEHVVYHETGTLQFSGNIHLLTNQRVIILNIGARNYLLNSILLSKITGVDIDGIREGWLNSIIYGLRINSEDDDRPIMIKHGGVATKGNEKQETDLIKRQQINERFPRKICEVAGLGFAVPQKSIGPGDMTIVNFYSKSDLAWPARCSACYTDGFGLTFDEYTVENPWVTAGYSLGFGLIPQFTYPIPYCPACYNERFASEKNQRAVKAGLAQSNGARVELLFENLPYAMEFIRNNST